MTFSAMPATRLILSDRAAHPHVLCLTLQRPEARNAYNAVMINELEQWLDWSEQQADIRTVILTGSGSSFCSGADLQEAFADGGNALRNRHGGYSPLQFQPRRKIWIAALNGHAVGGGLEMALSCDFIIAAEGVKIALPEVRHGLLPLGGAIAQLATRLPANLARELLLTGAAMPAARALALGLFNQVCPAAQLQAAALALAEQISANAPLAVQACNALLGRALDGTQSAGATENELSQLQQSADYAESQRAFAARLTPRWQGK